MGIFIYAGIIGGLLSGIVKLGWEVMFPPRTPERNATNPPQELLQQLGFSSEFTHQTYTFSNMQLPWVSFIVHFSFSIVIAIIYCILVKKYAYLAMGQGAVFGIAIWVLLFGYYSTLSLCQSCILYLLCGINHSKSICQNSLAISSG